MSNTLQCITRYEEGLRTGDISKIPFHDDVSFYGVEMEQPLRSREAVIEFLSEAAKQMSNFRIKQSIVQGQHACALIEFSVGEATIEGCDYFKISDDRISEVRVYFDSRAWPEG